MSALGIVPQLPLLLLRNAFRTIAFLKKAVHALEYDEILRRVKAVVSLPAADGVGEKRRFLSPET